MYCTNCGVEATGHFCHNCGAPVPRVEPSAYCESVYPQPPVGEYAGSLCSVSVDGDSVSIKKNFIKTETRILFQDIVNVSFKKGATGGFICIRDKERANVPLSTSFKSASDPLSADFSSKDANRFFKLYEFLRSVSEINDYPIQENAISAPSRDVARKTPIGVHPPAPRSVAAEKDKPVSKRERIKENKKNGIACCPKCGSTSISAGKRGFGFGKAVVGATLTLGVGVLAGGIGANKTVVTCLNCGHKWKL